VTHIIIVETVFVCVYMKEYKGNWISMRIICFDQNQVHQYGENEQQKVRLNIF